MDLTRSLLNLTVGGSAWVLWLLIGLSVASVAIMVDKALIFYRCRFNQNPFVAEIEPYLRQGDWPRIISRCEPQSAMEARVLLPASGKFPGARRRSRTSWQESGSGCPSIWGRD